MSKLLEHVEEQVKLLPIERKVLEDEYLLHENANKSIKILYIASLIRDRIKSQDRFNMRLFGSVYKLHLNSDLHLNKLPYSCWMPYCGSTDLMKIALEGLGGSYIKPRPPRHVISFSEQASEGACELAGERTGAVGFGNFLQAFAFIISRDDMKDPKIVKQAVEHFVWSCNYSNKRLAEGLFINIDFRLDPRFGGYEYQKLTAKLLLKTMLEGDAYSKPFTFPLVTFYYNDRQLKLLEEDRELWELFWKATAERGVFYFMAHENAVEDGEKLREDDIFSFCCRLQCRKATLRRKRFMNSMSVSTGTGTGSIGYFTINIPRLVYLHGDKYQEALYELISMGVRNYLLTLWYRYLYFTKLGFYPFTTWALGEDWYIYYFVTIATCGTAEAVAILLGEPRLWTRGEVGLDGEELFDDVLYWYAKLLGDIRRICEQVEKELNAEGHDIIINIEQSPAEYSSARFARSDWKKYPEMRKYIPVGKSLKGTLEPFYTSQITPYYSNWRLYTQLELEGKLQNYYTGGVNKLIRIHRPLPVESVIELVETCRKLGLIYYTYVPTQNICPKCGYRTIGLYYTCPKCGTEMELWSRIVGYYRPVRQWNPSKQAEFTTTRGLVD